MTSLELRKINKYPDNTTIIILSIWEYTILIQLIFINNVLCYFNRVYKYPKDLCFQNDQFGGFYH